MSRRCSSTRLRMRNMISARLRQRRRPPGREGGLGRGDGRVDLLDAREVHLAGQLARSPGRRPAPTVPTCRPPGRPPIQWWTRSVSVGVDRGALVAPRGSTTWVICVLASCRVVGCRVRASPRAPVRGAKDTAGPPERDPGRAGPPRSQGAGALRTGVGSPDPASRAPARCPGTAGGRAPGGGSASWPDPGQDEPGDRRGRDTRGRRARPPGAVPTTASSRQANVTSAPAERPDQQPDEERRSVVRPEAAEARGRARCSRAPRAATSAPYSWAGWAGVAGDERVPRPGAGVRGGPRGVRRASPGRPPPRTRDSSPRAIAGQHRDRRDVQPAADRRVQQPADIGPGHASRRARRGRARGCPGWGPGSTPGSRRRSRGG